MADAERADHVRCVDEHVQELAVTGDDLVERWEPALRFPVAPLGSSSVRLPSWPTAKPEIVPPPALAV